MSHNRFPARVPPYGGETLVPSPFFAPASAAYAPYAVDMLGMVSNDALRDEIIQKMLVPPTTAAFGLSPNGVYGAMQTPTGNSDLAKFAAGAALVAAGGLLGAVLYAAFMPKPLGA